MMCLKVTETRAEANSKDVYLASKRKLPSWEQNRCHHEPSSPICWKDVSQVLPASFAAMPARLDKSEGHQLRAPKRLKSAGFTKVQAIMVQKTTEMTIMKPSMFNCWMELNINAPKATTITSPAHAIM